MSDVLNAEVQNSSDFESDSSNPENLQNSNSEILNNSGKETKPNANQKQHLNGQEDNFPLLKELENKYLESNNSI